MGFVNFQVKKYSVFLAPKKREGKFPDGSDNTYKMIGNIYCLGKDKTKQYSANLIFLAKSSPAPSDVVKFQEDMNWYQGSFFIPYEERELFEWFVDVLRNEKPVFFRLDESPEHSYLYTTEETVGEEESGPIRLFGWFE